MGEKKRLEVGEGGLTGHVEEAGIVAPVFDHLATRVRPVDKLCDLVHASRVGHVLDEAARGVEAVNFGRLLVVVAHVRFGFPIGCWFVH